MIGILALLAALLMPTFMAARQRMQASTCLSNTRQWGIALLSYTQDYEGNYPPALTATFINDFAKASGGEGWFTFLQPYTGNHYFFCPSAWASHAYQNLAYSCGYGFNLRLNDTQKQAEKMNYQGKQESAVQIPASTITIFDVRAGIIASDIPDLPGSNEVFGVYTDKMEAEIKAQTPGAIRHNGGGNYAFADGHAKWLRPEGIVIPCEGIKPCFKP